MELYKIEKNKDKIYLKVLSYNQKVWFPWQFLYFREDSYPTEDIRYAKVYTNEEELMEDVNKYIPFDKNKYKK